MVQEQTLDNGLRVLLVPVPAFQSVSVGIFVGIGSRYEDESAAGAAHFIEHMLFKGTARRPSAQLIAEAIEGIGGLSNAYTDQESTVYYAKVAASQVRVAIDVLADMVRHSRFDPVEFEKERSVIGEELKMVYDSPDEWVDVLVDQLIWPDHPLGRNIAGTHQSLAGMSRDSLVAFYERHYQPRTMLVAVAGAFEPEAVVAQLKSLLGEWQPGPLPAFKPAPPPPTVARWLVEARPIEQGHLNLALPTLSRSHPDRYVLSVLNTILGDGMSSRLFLKIREEQGLAYAVDSGLNLLRDTGSLVIYAGVDPARAVEALQAILDELARLGDEPVPEKELRKAKEYLKGRLVLGLEDSFNRAAWVAYQALFLDRIKTPAELLQAYEAVTAADIQNLARKIFQPARYSLAAVGPLGDGDQLGRLLVP